jgi:hypothetical protein
MNKIVVLIALSVIVISKGIVLKSILIDSPAYRSCISEEPLSSNVAHPCGTDPFIYFIIGWFITVGGFVFLIVGLRMHSLSAISR